MADDTPPVETAPDPRDEKIADLSSKLDRAIATMESMGRSQNTQQAPQQQQVRPPTRGADIPAHLRQHILSQGMSEADLDANAPLILPIINTILGAAASEMVTMLNSVRDEVTIMKMASARGADGTDKYPFIDKLGDEIASVREDAARQGRYYDPDTAYSIAFARKGRDLEREAAGHVPAPTVRARDATTTTSIASRASSAVRDTVPTTPSSAQDLQSMSKTERDAFFQANQDTPIR